jgi:hypothetical protein
MALFKKKKTPTSPMEGSTAADLERYRKEVLAGPEKPTDLPEENDPDIVEAKRMNRRKAAGRRGLASTIMTGGQLSDLGYDTKTTLG